MGIDQREMCYLGECVVRVAQDDAHACVPASLRCCVPAFLRHVNLASIFLHYQTTAHGYYAYPTKIEIHE